MLKSPKSLPCSTEGTILVIFDGYSLFSGWLVNDGVVVEKFWFVMNIVVDDGLMAKASKTEVVGVIVSQVLIDFLTFRAEDLSYGDGFVPAVVINRFFVAYFRDCFRFCMCCPYPGVLALCGFCGGFL